VGGAGQPHPGLTAVAALAPPVAAVRVAVRKALTGTPGKALVACSGGPDSLALAAGTAFVAPRLGVPAGLVTVDHGLQAGSADRAVKVAAWAREAGFDPVLVRTVSVGGRPGGPEAAARAARYEALVDAARGVGAATVLLGHTRDDQAETVLLALARGGGPRGLAGMPRQRVLGGVTFLRPLLDVARADTRAACAALKLEPWDDPHNADPRYGRTRVRALVAALGPAVVASLARTAALLADDVAVLDALAEAAAEEAGDGTGGLRVDVLAGLPRALRTRVLHGWARALGVPGNALAGTHVAALDALVTDWHGQGPVALPGGVHAGRRTGIIRKVD
jgi:tRNA(Ile)-lysidine synthase